MNDSYLITLVLILRASFFNNFKFYIKLQDTPKYITTKTMAADTKHLYPIAVLIDELKSEDQKKR